EIPNRVVRPFDTGEGAECTKSLGVDGVSHMPRQTGERCTGSTGMAHGLPVVGNNRVADAVDRVPDVVVRAAIELNGIIPVVPTGPRSVVIIEVATRNGIGRIDAEVDENVAHWEGEVSARALAGQEI